MRKRDYIYKPAIAVYASSAFSGIEILEVSEDHVIVRDWVHRYTKEGKAKTEEIHRYQLYLDTGRVYFRYRNGLRYHLDDFIRV